MKRREQPDEENPAEMDESTESMVYDGDIYTAMVRADAEPDPKVTANADKKPPELEDDNSAWPFIR